MKRFLFLIIIAVSSVMMSAAEYTPSTVPDPKKNGQHCYVSNPDAILSDSTVQWLNMCAQRLYDSTLVEMAVVALQSIGEMDAFDFSYELFQRWGIGGKDRNTGVLILFVMDSHDIRITTGTGIEGVLTDARCSFIVHDVMIPCFRQGEYELGLRLGAVDIYDYCTDGNVPEELLHVRSVTNRGRYANANADDDDDEDEEDERIEFWVMMFFIFFIVNVFVAVSIEQWKERRVCPKCGKRKGKRQSKDVIKEATLDTEGLGLFHYHCQNCGHTWAAEEVIPKLVHHSSSDSDYDYDDDDDYDSSSSGGGSWGGGSTSGGGAGGKW